MPSATWRRIVLAAVAAFLAGATARGFDGEPGPVPTPPRQAEPWTPPATRLPPFLVSATRTLFEQGMADPRGCEYRNIEIDILKVWVAGGQPTNTRTHGWVLPRTNGRTENFAVCWNGLVYPVAKVGDTADLEADLRALVESIKSSRAETAKSGRPPFPRGVRGGMPGSPDSRPVAVDWRSPIKIGLLLRLGRADLAESLFAAETVWKPEITGRDLTDYGISYLTLASEWALSLFDRAVDAHMRGYDRLALADTRLLVEASRKIEARAAVMGFPRPDPRNRIGAPDHPYLGYLGQLETLHEDQERRAREPRRQPPPPDAPPAVRIAALIRDLDQIGGANMGLAGGINARGGEVVRKLIAEGDDAVEPLLAVLESDRRLTRTVSFGRSMSSPYRDIQGVQGPALDALAGILQTRNFGGTTPHALYYSSPEEYRKLAATIRAYWEKNRGISPVERWYRVLDDDAATPARWQEAASILTGQPRPGQPPLNPGFDARHDPHHPSVAELLARRALDLAKPGRSPGPGGYVPLTGACALALALNRWDAGAARPVLAAVMTRCLDERGGRSGGGDRSPYSSLLDDLPRLADARAASGDLAALDPFPEIVRGLTEQDLMFPRASLLDLMARYPDHPAMARAAEWLFNDPASPWLPKMRREHFQSLGSPWYLKPGMLKVAGFRKRLESLLDDTTELGTVTVHDNKNGKSRMITWKDQEAMVRRGPSAATPSSESTFRVCDYIAWQFSLLRLPGTPPFELEWPQSRRDEALEACRQALKPADP